VHGEACSGTGNTVGACTPILAGSMAPPAVHVDAPREQRAPDGPRGAGLVRPAPKKRTRRAPSSEAEDVERLGAALAELSGSEAEE
jgi:hypothetical protein